MGNGAAHTRDPGTGWHRAGRGRFAAAYRAVARRGVRREWPSRSRRATAPSCSARRQFQRLRRACWGPTAATPVAASAGKAAESSTSPAVARFFAESTTELASERTTLEQLEAERGDAPQRCIGQVVARNDANGLLAVVGCSSLVAVRVWADRGVGHSAGPFRGE